MDSRTGLLMMIFLSVAVFLTQIHCGLACSRSAYYYHYTDEDTCDKIVDSQVMYRGTRNRPNAKPGVYFTTLKPSKGKCTIAINNWGVKDATGRVKGGGVDCALRVEISKSDMVDHSYDNRDIFAYEKGDLSLSDHSYTRSTVSGSNVVTCSSCVLKGSSVSVLVIITLWFVA